MIEALKEKAMINMLRKFLEENNAIGVYICFDGKDSVLKFPATTHPKAVQQIINDNNQDNA